MRTTRSFIDRAEVRIFAADQSLQAEPIDVAAVDASGFAEWQPTSDHVGAPARELKYVLRAYDKNGNFDETSAAAAVARVRRRDAKPNRIPRRRSKQRETSCSRATAKAGLRSATFVSAAAP